MDEDGEQGFVPYPAEAVPQSHISNLAALGRLYGLPTQSPTHASVLELGCASGRNLLPMAVTYPEGDFVGVDADDREIGLGLACLRQSAIDNLELRTGDLRDEPQRGKKYDYVICHGVYSWVPPGVRRVLSSTIRELLRPGGIGYVSFNATPGWHARAAVRQMVLCKTAHVEAPLDKVRIARDYLGFLVQHAAPHGEYRSLLEDELSSLQGRSTGYALQDLLAPENEGFSFTEFHSDAVKSELRYLCDAESPTGFESLDTEVRENLRGLGLVEREQTYDDLVRRTFRSSLVIRAEETAHEFPDAEALRELFLASPTELQVAEKTGASTVYRHEGASERFTIKDQLSRTVLDLLLQSVPGAHRFDALVELIARDSRNSPSTIENALLPRLLRFLHMSLVKVRADPPVCGQRRGGHLSPVPWLRWGAQHGELTTGRHETARLTSEQLSLLRGVHVPLPAEEIAKSWSGNTNLSEREALDLLQVFYKKGLLV